MATNEKAPSTDAVMMTEETDERMETRFIADAAHTHGSSMMEEEEKENENELHMHNHPETTSMTIPMTMTMPSQSQSRTSTIRRTAGTQQTPEEKLANEKLLQPRRQFKVLKWHYAESDMPHRLSDVSVTQALAPNDDGDLSVLLYVIGGCEDESRSSLLDESAAGEIGAAFMSRRVGGIFPTCWDVGQHTFTYDPKMDLFAKRKDAPRRRYRHGAALVDGNIWVVGGRDAQDRIVKEVDVSYDQVTVVQLQLFTVLTTTVCCYSCLQWVVLCCYHSVIVIAIAVVYSIMLHTWCTVLYFSCST
jgi:hypothetical protein